MQHNHHIVSLLGLTLLFSPLMYAATCPTDSVIGYDQNSNPITKTLYQYDKSGRVLVSETWKINADSMLIGTTKTTTEYYSNGKVKSTANWVWSTAITPNGWVGKDRNDYTYDNQGNTTSWSIFTWDTTTNNWTNKNKYEYQYENKKQTLAITYTGDGDKWIPKTKSETKYDAKGHTILDRYYGSYDAAHSKWIGDHWYESKYNASNQLILSKKYTWDTGKGDWKGESQSEYGYNTAGKQTLYIYYTWDASKSAFVGSSKNIYDYDQWTNITLQEQYTYNATKKSWQGTQKVRYEYTAYKSDPIMTATFLWDSISALFIGVDSIRTALDEAKNQILDERYTYNVTGKSWQGTLKEEKIYDVSKNIISKRTYQWQSSQWINATKDSSAYDANKNKILEEHYTWDTTENYWVGTGEKHVSEYTNNKETLREVYIWKDEIKDWTYKSKIIQQFDGRQRTLYEEYALTNNVLVGTKKEKYAYNAKGETVMTVKYTWLHDEVWQGQDSLLVNYDDKKNQILDERYTYNVTNQSWVGTLKKEYAFNSLKQQVMFATYQWQGGTWVGTQKEERELDDEGREILVASYKWSSGAWVGKNRAVTAYYKDKLIASLVNYTWKSNQWVGKDSTLYAYNEADVQSAKYTFSWQENAWQLSQKWEAHFDDAGRKDVDSTMVYKNDTWIYLNKNTNTYDNQNRLILILTEQWKDGVPSSGSKTSNTYGAFGLTNTLTSELQGGTWVVLSQKDNTYNTAGRLTLSVKQQYKNGEVVAGERITYEYTATERIETTSIWENQSWVEQTRIGYYRSGNLSVETHYIHDGTQWVGNTKVETTTIGKNKEIAQYQWQGSWVGISKIGTYYNEYEDQTSASWNWKNSTWVCDVKKGESYYTTTGKLKSQTTYKIVDNTFVLSSREEYEYGTHPSDLTTATYQWNATNKVWDGVSKLGVTYASNGKKASEFSFVWKDTCWLNDNKTEWEYGEGKNISTATYKGVDSTWVGIGKLAETYTSSGDSLSIYTYCWKNNTWVDSLKREFTYNEYGDIILYIDALMSDTGWTNKTTSTKWDVVYYDYSKGLTTLDAHYYWRESKNTWAGKGTKWENTYDENGNKTLEMKSSWKSSGWQYSSKQEWAFDEYGYTILRAYWTRNGNKWEGLTKSEYRYSANKTQLMSATYKFNNNKDIWDWQGISKSEVILDEQDKKIGDISYKWSTSLWTWIGLFKYEYTYDDQGRTLEQLTYRYSEADGWYLDTKTINEYDTKHGKIGSYIYEFVGGDMRPQSIAKQTYDEDANTKQRTDLYAIWTDGNIQTYEDKTYYYACDPKYIITVNTKEAGVGEVSGGGEYTYYARRRIAATADPACTVFNQWIDGETSLSRIILVTEDKTYTAEFTPIQHTVRATVRGKGGSVVVTKKE